MVLVLCFTIQPANAFAQETSAVNVDEKGQIGQVVKDETEKPESIPAEPQEEVKEQPSMLVEQEQSMPKLDLPSFDMETPKEKMIEATDKITEPEKQMTDTGAATTTKISGDYEYQLVDDGVKITKYIGEKTEIVIPDTLEDKAVVAIGEYAFSSCYSLNRIEILPTVTTIADGAFSSYSGLKIYGQVGSAAQVYAYRYGLVFIDINGQKSGDFYYEDYSNEHGQGVRIISYDGEAKDLQLNTLEGKNILAIGKYAFKKNTALEKLTIGSQVRVIESYAFYDCATLKEMNLSEGIAEIQFSAFSHTGLETVALPNSVKRMDDGAFSSCESLKRITIGMGITIIPDRFLDYCIALESVEFKGAITEIRSSAFANCINLRQIKIPESVTAMGDSVFYGNKSICILGKTGSYAEQYAKKNELAFIRENAKKLGDFYYEETNDGAKIVGYLGNTSSLSIPQNLGDKSVTAIGTSVFRDNAQLEKVIFGNKIKTVDPYAFEGCWKLTSLTLNEGLEKIGSYAFQYTGITVLKLPDSLIKLGEAEDTTARAIGTGFGSFENCKNLKVVEIGEGLKKIPKVTFATCKNLDTVNFSPKSTLEIIDSDAFRYCSNLRNIAFPESLKEIKDTAFRSCENLKKVVIPASVQTIARGSEDPETGAFASCEKIFIFGKQGTEAEAYAAHKKVPFISEKTPRDDAYYYEVVNGGAKIILADAPGKKEVPAALGGKTTVEIGNNAFYGDKDLEIISLKQVKNIGKDAFSYCEKVNTIQLSENLENIGDWAFDHCREVQSVNVPDSTRTMGTGAFNYCEKMTSVTLGTGIETIENNTFTYTSLKTMNLPVSIKTVNAEAFTHLLETVTIPEAAQDVTLKDGSLSTSEFLKSAYLPAGVTTIEDRAFNPEWQPDVTIYGETGTVAEAYAIAHNINFSTDVWLLGDVNRDKAINASDALQSLRHSVKEIELKDSDFTRGDVNRDTIVNASDALQILRYSVKEINNFD